jgi:hypothetical protein
MKKLIAFAGALLVALACSEGQQAPTEVQFAKGGKKGKPSKDQVRLLEYWVEPRGGNTSMIHVLAEGNATTVGGTVAHDYHFNGMSEYFHNPPHYEYRHFDGIERVELEELGDGIIHADILWSGTKDFDAGQLFRDQLTTDVDGADPFVFGLHFQMPDDGDIQVIYPRGVVVDGEVVGVEGIDVSSGLHGDLTVNSFALFSGDDPAGYVWVEELSLSNASCDTRRQRGDPVTFVTADVHAVLGSGPGAPPHAWVEFHLVAGGSDITEGVTAITDEDITGMTVKGMLAGARESLELSVWFDYIVPLLETADYVYDPDNNTNQGFTTDFTVATAPVETAGPPAVASTEPVTVVCR